MEEISKKILTLLSLVENSISSLLLGVLDQKDKGVFDSPTPLSVTFKDTKKIWHSKSNTWKFIKAS